MRGQVIIARFKIEGEMFGDYNDLTVCVQVVEGGYAVFIDSGTLPDGESDRRFTDMRQALMFAGEVAADAADALDDDGSL